jgi:hypothetical protein
MYTPRGERVDGPESTTTVLSEKYAAHHLASNPRTTGLRSRCKVRVAIGAQGLGPRKWRVVEPEWHAPGRSTPCDLMSLRAGESERYRTSSDTMFKTD